MKDIISIDFDIVMAPCIQSYNALPGDWDERIEHTEILKMCYPDYTMYQSLTKYVVYLFTSLPKEKIHFIRNHEDIIKFIPKAEEFNLYHYDHHHDYAYNEKDKDKIQQLDCGNWIKYLYENEYLIKNIVWIRDKNSMLENPDFFELPESFSKTFIEELKDFSKTLPDELIICMSPPWIPPHIQPLFYLWMDVANEIHKTHYNFE